MRRYYICPVKEYEILNDDGTLDHKLHAAKIREYLPGFNYVAHIPTNSTTGKPINNWAIVCVEAPDHSKLEQDVEFIQIPHNDDHEAQKIVPADFKSKAILKGINLGVTESVKSMCNKIGKKLSPNYDFDKEKV